MNALKAPFPWFGGKSQAAALIWQRLSDVPNYVEPFFGSGAVMLGRPTEPGIETVNDADGFVCNAWRAIKHAPDEVARWADWPVNECDLHARHSWLKPQRQALTRRLEGDPDYFDAKIAGWWLWGMACWIGTGFCSRDGPWVVVEDGDGFKRLVKREGGRLSGVSRSIVHLGNAGRGVKRPNPGTGKGGLLEWMRTLAERFAGVRVCCGDWTRVFGPTPTEVLGLTGIVLDPPYAMEIRDSGCYGTDAPGISAAVREWAIAHGDNPKLRIALCGYDGEHEMPDSWECVAWTACGGYSVQGNSGNNNREKERVWFSRHCLNPSKTNMMPQQMRLFGG